MKNIEEDIIKDLEKEMMENEEPIYTPFSLLRNFKSVFEAKDYDWVVQDLFAKQAVSFMFGEAGCGKTWLIMDLIFKLGNGEDVFGSIETNPSKTLLIEGDAPDTLIKDRIVKFGNILDAHRNTMYSYMNKYSVEQSGRALDLYSTEGMKNIEKCIKASQCDIVIIDTLISFIKDEKDPVEMQKSVQFLRKLAYTYNCHILICHHCRKKDSKMQNSKLEQSDMIGTSVLNRLASIIIAVEKIQSPTNTTEGMLSIKKSWYKEISPIHFVLEDTFNNNMPGIKLTYEVQENITSTLQKAVNRIKEHIKKEKLFEFKRKDITKTFCDLSQNIIKKALIQLQEEGYIEASGNTNSRLFKVIHLEDEPNIS